MAGVLGFRCYLMLSEPRGISAIAKDKALGWQAIVHKTMLAHNALYFPDGSTPLSEPYLEAFWYKMGLKKKVSCFIIIFLGGGGGGACLLCPHLDPPLQSLRMESICEMCVYMWNVCCSIKSNHLQQVNTNVNWIISMSLLCWLTKGPISKIWGWSYTI